MRWKYLVLLAGCATQDLDPGADPDLAEWQGSVTACASGTWCLESSPAPSNTLLHGVWAASATDVFAVGDTGIILRRADDTWTTMASGSTTNLLAVWGSSSSDVWAGGVSGKLLHFDGTAWSAVGGVTIDVNAIWGTSANDVWVVGQGTAVHWNGSSFSANSLGIGGSLLSVSGASSSDVWATGENANVRHLTGGTWTSMSTGVSSTMFAVLAVGSSDVWVSTSVSGKETVHWDGSRWTAIAAGKAVFNSMSALASSDIWGVGLIRRVSHWNGTAWAIEQPIGTSGTLWGVTTVPGHAWIVGDGNLIAHRTF